MQSRLFAGLGDKVMMKGLGNLGLCVSLGHLFLNPVHCQFEQTTFSLNGEHLYTSLPGAQVTETVTAAESAPTLYYNCEARNPFHKLPPS